MKTLPACLLALALAAPRLFAQTQPPAAEPALPGAEPGGRNSQPGTLMPETPPLITAPAPSLEPAAPLPPGALPETQTPGMKQSKTLATEEDLKGRIRYREVKTQALRDPEVQRTWARAQAAKTDPQKREAMREYYTQLFGRMLKIDGSLAPRIQAHKTLSLARIAQAPAVEQAAANKKPAPGGGDNDDE